MRYFEAHDQLPDGVASSRERIVLVWVKDWLALHVK